MSGAAFKQGKLPGSSPLLAGQLVGRADETVDDARFAGGMAGVLHDPQFGFGPDLLQIPCSSEYIEKNGESLCREMFCRMNTRSGNQSNAASSKECESISNLINTKIIIEACKEYEPDKRDKCERLFEKRK